MEELLQSLLRTPKMLQSCAKLIAPKGIALFLSHINKYFGFLLIVFHSHLLIFHCLNIYILPINLFALICIFKI